MDDNEVQNNLNGSLESSQKPVPASEEEYKTLNALLESEESHAEERPNRSNQVAPAPASEPVIQTELNNNNKLELSEQSAVDETN